jgi:hypothetical protein
MTEIPESIFKRNIFRFVTTVEKFKMLSIFCSFLSRFFCCCCCCYSTREGPFFGLNHRSQVGRTIGQKESCRGGRLVTAPWCPFTLQRKSQTTNQQKTRDIQQTTQSQRPHIYPKPSFISSCVRSFYLFIYLFFVVVVVFVILKKKNRLLEDFSCRRV